MSFYHAAHAAVDLLSRGVWLAPWLLSGAPVYVAVDGTGNLVSWGTPTAELSAAELEASLWAALDRADPQAGSPHASSPPPFALRLVTD